MQREYCQNSGKDYTEAIGASATTGRLACKACGKNGVVLRATSDGKMRKHKTPRASR